MTDDLKYLIALSHFPKFGPKRLTQIKNYFHSFKNAFQAGNQQLTAAGIQEKVALEFTAARISIDPDSIIQRMDNENIKAIDMDDELYPALLKEIYDPPALLYYKGRLEKNDEYTLAIVGTRKFTSYGKQAVEHITRPLVQNNITIVSGLALGIDTLAHRACLDASGRTIAVLGTGLNKQSIYPSSNRWLADKIIDANGAVISEFPLDTQPFRSNFPQRNRIISGLSLGTVVIEAGERSGALITAKSALDQNREVFAVPGSIFSPVSVGPNNLIKQGAKAVTSAEEIMEALDLAEISIYIDNKQIIPDTKEESELITHLTHEPRHIDELIRLTGMSASAINATLTIMEMKGIIKNLGNMEYVLAR